MKFSTIFDKGRFRRERKIVVIKAITLQIIKNLYKIILKRIISEDSPWNFKSGQNFFHKTILITFITSHFSTIAKSS